MYNVGRLGFFVRPQSTFCFGRNWDIRIYSARNTLAHFGKTIFFTDIDRKNCQSTSDRKDDRSRSKKEASPHDADRTFPYWHHAYFIKGLNRKLNSRHRSWSSPDWYFSADIAQFFFKKRSLAKNVFFTAEEVFLFWCCIKNVQYRSARFFCAISTDVLFRPKLAYSHLFGQENISPSRQKNIFHRYWLKKLMVDVRQERIPNEV